MLLHSSQKKVLMIISWIKIRVYDTRAVDIRALVSSALVSGSLKIILEFHNHEGIKHGR